MKTNYESFFGCDCSYGKAKLVLFGAPFALGTGQRPGERFGPGAIRHGSYVLETYSPYQKKDLTDCAAADYGDLVLKYGCAEDVLSKIETRTKVIASGGKIPLLLGGDHLATLGSVRALCQKYPRLHIIQFDAHANLRDACLGTGLCHNCVMRRCYELVGEHRIHQFCIRSGTREEFSFAAQHMDLHLFDFGWLDPIVSRLIREEAPIYLSIDLDCLDPAVMPGTGFPEAGGVLFPELLHALISVCRANVVGADVTGLAPMLDHSGASSATAAKVVRELILALSGDSGKAV